MCGDFNSITDINDRIPIKDIPITRDGKLLKKVCETSDMKDTFRELYPNKCDFTRVDKFVRTRIDRIYISKGIKIWSYRNEYIVDSDHLGVNVRLNLGYNEKRGYWKLNIQCLKNKSVLKKAKEEIKRVKD